MPPRKVAILTAGGLAPCLSAATGGLIERYTALAPDIELICYRNGYKGLLLGDKIPVADDLRDSARILRHYGGSPIGNSRVKLTNIADCVKRGLVKEGQDPLAVAAEQLKRDEVDVLHTIGGDDTNTTAADLAAYLAKEGRQLTVIGLPKTIDNDIIPVRQSLGALTAAREGAMFFQRVVAEHSSSTRMLIIHEIMGRHCGWLAAATTYEYLKLLESQPYVPSLGLRRNRLSVHGVYLPELPFDITAEAARVRAVMDLEGNANIFLSEGAGLEQIVAEMIARGEEPPRDPFGHVKLDLINPGKWFGERFAKLLGADKVLVQKSGYFARAAAANSADLGLIDRCVRHAVICALRGESSVVGEDEERGGELRAIEFSRIKGGKHFDIHTPWFEKLLVQIGQAGTTAPAA